jgi:hypothetical protein
MSGPRSLVSLPSSRSSLPVLGFQGSARASVPLARASEKWISGERDASLSVPGVPLDDMGGVNVYNAANSVLAAAREVPSAARQMPQRLVSSSKAGRAVWPASGVFLSGNKEPSVVVTSMPEAAKVALDSRISACMGGKTAPIPLSEWPFEPPVVSVLMPTAIAASVARPQVSSDIVVRSMPPAINPYNIPRA